MVGKAGSTQVPLGAVCGVWAQRTNPGTDTEGKKGWIVRNWNESWTRPCKNAEVTHIIKVWELDTDTPLTQRGPAAGGHQTDGEVGKSFLHIICHSSGMMKYGTSYLTLSKAVTSLTFLTMEMLNPAAGIKRGWKCFCSLLAQILML